MAYYFGFVLGWIFGHIYRIMIVIGVLVPTCLFGYWLYDNAKANKRWHYYQRCQKRRRGLK